MTGSHLHGPGTGAVDLGDFVLGTSIAVVWILLVALYLVAGRAAVLRGRTTWPARRTIAWSVGAAAGLAVSVGPIARAGAESFPVHMAVHLVLGMLVPLLFVLGAPVTLFLRAVPASVGRRYTRLVASAPVRVLAHPLVALALTTVPMVLVYGGGRALDLLHHPVLGPVLHVHFVAAGFLFAYAVIGTDPNPHRASERMRGSVIVVGIAVHGVLAKHLIAVGQQGVPAIEVEQAAQLMYYGGDAVHVLLLGVFCARIYRRTGRRTGRQTGTSGLDRRLSLDI